MSVRSSTRADSPSTSIRDGRTSRTNLGLRRDAADHPARTDRFAGASLEVLALDAPRRQIQVTTAAHAEPPRNIFTVRFFPIVILENGVIRTLDPSLPGARALAIAGDRIAGGVGTHETALASPEVVDLGGRCVVPGFTDAHVHFLQWSLAQRQVRLESARTLEDAVARVAAVANETPTGRWIRGTGWRSGEWQPPVEPTKGALDAVTGDTPAALMAKDGHSLWLNSAALAAADGDLQVPGGVVELDEHGEPTGVLREESAWEFRRRYVLSQVSDEERLDAMRAGIRLAVSRGVTAVHDKDGWLGDLRLFQRLRDESVLNLRVWQSLPHEFLDELEALDFGAGLGDEWLRAGYLKAFMDGTLGSQTARMLDGSGVEITSREELEQIVRRAARIGWPVAVHAIGDRANRDALDAFEATRDEWAPKGLRPRIEHAQCLAPEDLHRFAQLGVAASVQFSHAPSDRDLADRYWAGKTDGAYAFRSLWESGAVVANGSDAPIEELDPLAGIRAGVLRTIDERPAWHAEQALTVEQALEATCVTPAWLCGDERRRGKLLPGFLADVTVLSTDPLEDLGGCEVVATMAGGRWIFNPPPWQQ
jgi:predicted amidohydrolase YtcJ